MVATAGNDSDVFAAIGHPARRLILDLLAQGDRSVKGHRGALPDK